MKIYLAGPMSGIEEHNFPAFRAATQSLREHGFEVVSPHEISETLGVIGEGTDLNQENYAKCMGADIAALLDVDGVIVLPGWENSRGARIEVLIAQTLCKPVKFFDSSGLRPISKNVLTAVVP